MKTFIKVTMLVVMVAGMSAPAFAACESQVGGTVVDGKPLKAEGTGETKSDTGKQGSDKATTGTPGSSGQE